MFRENNEHRQLSFIESVNFMDESIRERLDNSWAPVFYKNVFCNIDESKFEVLYADCGRPNFPVNISLSLEYIKHMFDYSDDDLIEQYYFNYLVSYAVGNRALGEKHLAERTLYEFRRRVYQYALSHPNEEDLVFKQFINLTLKCAKLTGTILEEQRMDSTMIMSNIKKAGRLALIYDVLAQAIKAMPDHLITEKFQALMKADYKKEILYKSKPSEADGKITVLIECCKEILEIAEKDAEYSDSDAIRVLKRMLSEQTETDKKTGEIIEKPKEKIDSESLQSAFDEDATFRKKSGKNHVGYSVNLSESCAKQNEVQLLTDYEIAKNTKSDVAFGKERIPEIVSNTGLKELYTDGGYYCEELANNSDVVVHFTDMTGKEPSSEKLPIDSFVVDQNTDVIVKCAADKCPISSIKKEDLYTARFDLETCINCDLKETCRVKFQKNDTVIRITTKSLLGAEFRNDININHKEYTSKRVAIEGSNSELKRAHSMGKLKVRGMNKCKLVVGLKVTACNIKRTMNHMLKKLKGLSTPAANEKGKLSTKQGVFMPI